MQTTKQFILNQIALADEIKSKANINIVTCGNCGTILLHRIPAESIHCDGCKQKMNLSDCSDLFYKGMENEWNQSN